VQYLEIKPVSRRQLHRIHKTFKIQKKKNLVLIVQTATKMKKKKQLSFGTLLSSGCVFGCRPLGLKNMLRHCKLITRH